MVFILEISIAPLLSLTDLQTVLVKFLPHVNLLFNLQ
jgi:hypothetical protein